MERIPNINQPTEDRIKKVEQKQEDADKRVSRIEQRQTEEIRALRSEATSVDTRLGSIQENTNIAKIQMEGARADIRVVKANQSDLRGYIEEQFKVVEENQDKHAEILGSLITSAETQEALLKKTATKDDIASMVTKDELKSELSAMETRLIETMTRLLQQRPSE